MTKDPTNQERSLEQSQEGARRATFGVYLVAALVAVGSVALFLVFETKVFFAKWGDEMVHIYVSRRVAEGALLYRDIHSARPPLAILPLALLQWLGISPLMAARSLAALYTIAIGGVLHWAGSRLYGAAVGLLAFALFMSCPDGVMRFQYTGIHLVALLATLALALAWFDRPLWAGIAAGLAIGAGQHAVIAVILAGAFIWLHGAGKLATYAAACATVFAVSVAYFVIRGTDIVQDILFVHLYHMQEGAPMDKAESELGFDLLTWFGDNALFFLAAIVGLAVRTRSRKAEISATGRSSRRARHSTRERRPGGTVAKAPDMRRRLLDSRPEWRLAAFIACHVFAIVSMRGGHVLYTYVCVPMLVLLAARGICQAYAWWNERRLIFRLPKAVRVCSFVSGVTGVAYLGCWSTSAALEKRDDETYSAIPHLRSAKMAEMQAFVQAKSAAQMIREQGLSDETIFGQAPLAAAVAVESGLRVAGELADLPPRWILMGKVRREDIVEKLERDKVGYFVTPPWFFYNDPFFRAYLDHCFAHPRVFHRAKGIGRGIPDFVMLRHKPLRPCH